MLWGTFADPRLLDERAGRSFHAGAVSKFLRYECRGHAETERRRASLLPLPTERSSNLDLFNVGVRS